MDLSAYFERIGFVGPAHADLATLRAVHRAHALAVPFENFDVQFGRPPSRSIGAIVEKLVTRRRGGWCYENNGLLASALDAIGFRVRRLAAGVARASMGDGAVGNHLTLLVDLGGEVFLCDAGFGNGLIEPVPLQDGRFKVGPFDCRIDSLGGGWRRFTNGDGPSESFDFSPYVSDDALLEERCAFLARDPSSPFVQNAVVQRWREDAHLSLRGRRFVRHAADGVSSRLIDDAADYVETLRREFDLDLPEAGGLWDRIVTRDVQRFGVSAADSERG